MNDLANFYRQGFVIKEFSQTPRFKELFGLLREMYSKPLKEDFQWIQKDKYEGSKDLRPYCFKYDDIFLDILFDQGIPKILEEITGRNLTLLHVKLRINLPGAPYSTWHRDTTFYNGRVKGNVPPAINLHYYPKFNEPVESQLKVWPGTHHLILPKKVLDRLVVKFVKGSDVLSHNTEYSILDTSLLHQITPTKYRLGATRLMYSFGHVSQEENFEDQRELHQIYHSKLKSWNL